MPQLPALIRLLLLSLTLSAVSTAAAGTTSVHAPPQRASVAAAASGGDDLGISLSGLQWLWASQASIDSDVARVRGLGVRWIRFDIPWFEIERVRGTRNWTQIDRIVGSAQRSGLRMVGVLTTVPAWATGDPSHWNTGISTAHQERLFVDFARSAAQRYRGRIAAFEIWNEPNLRAFWYPRPNVRRYASLLKATAPVVRAAAPGSLVVSGGTGGVSAATVGIDIDPRDWYLSLYRAGAAQKADVLGVHPYPNAWAPSPKPKSGEMLHAFAIQKIAYRMGDRNKPLWGTETGVPTAGVGSYSEAQVAALLPQLRSTWRTLQHPGPLFLYTLEDLPISDREGFFGVYRQDGSAKPAVLTIRTMAASSGPIGFVGGP